MSRDTAYSHRYDHLNGKDSRSCSESLAGRMEGTQFSSSKNSSPRHNRLHLSKPYSSSRPSSPFSVSRSPKSNPSLGDSTCPFAPSLPTHAGTQRVIGSGTQLLTADLTSLRAALKGAGVAVDQQPLARPQSRNSTLLQLQQAVAAPAPADAITSAGRNLDYSKIAAKLQESTARISSLSGKHSIIDAQRAGKVQVACSVSEGSSRPISSLDMNAADSVSEAPAAATTRGTRIGQSADSSAAHSLSSKGTAEALPSLQAQLAAFQGNLSKLAAAQNTALVAPEAAAAAAVISSQSSTEQPLTPMLSQALTLQRSGLLAASTSTTSSRMAAEAGLGPSLSNSSLHQQLQSQQQQHHDQFAVAQQLAQAGMAQLQEVTQLGQQLRPVVASLSGATADVQQRLQGLAAFFKQHPQYDAAALRRLIEDNKKLGDANKQLKQELFSKSQLLNSALAKVREQNHTPADKKTVALRDEVQMLKEQLHARDAALAAAEEDNRRLRDELGLPQRSCDSDLSPCKAEGEVYSGTSSPNTGYAASPGISRQLWADDDDPSSSTCTIASSHSRGAQQRAAAAAAAHQADKTLRAALAAKEQEVQQLQQQVEELKLAQDVMQPARALSPLDMEHLSCQESKVTRPRTLEDALQQLDGKTDMIARLQQQMLDQDQQSNKRAAERERAFQRQLQVEKTQLQHERQQGKLLGEQIQQLQEQLAYSQQQQARLQQDLDRAEQELQEAVAASQRGPNSSRDSTALQLENVNLQRHLQKQKDALISLQEAMHALRNKFKAAGRLVSLPQAAAADAAGQEAPLMRQLEASVQQLLVDVVSQPAQQKQQDLQQKLQQKLATSQHQNQQLQEQIAALEERCRLYEHEVQKAQRHLQASAEKLLELQQLTVTKQQLEREVEQWQRRVQEARAELDKALEGQQATAQHLNSCRQQLAEAKIDNAVLMDRIREFADREASRASANSSPLGMSLDAQQKLSAACAELNQQVGQLQRQLDDSHAKEERLHMQNAQLQERISALQLAGPAPAEQELVQQRVQQQAQQVQQVQDLQQQLEQERARSELLQSQLQQQQQQQDSTVSQLQQQLQERQQQLEHQQLRTQQLQQLLSQAQQDLQQLQGQLQQQQQAAAADGSQLQEELKALRDVLEDRTKEVLEWQVHADALEKDLADMKERADAADSMQEQLQHAQADIAVHEQQQQELQQELEQCKERMARLEYDLLGAGKDHRNLLSRFEAVTAELARVKETAADMRLRLEHYSGPAGPQARIRQLESSLQSLQRKYDAAESHASAATRQVEELTTKLGNAEDEILALEGQISILEQELAKYTL